MALCDFTGCIMQKDFRIINLDVIKCINLISFKDHWICAAFCFDLHSGSDDSVVPLRPDGRERQGSDLWRRHDVGVDHPPDLRCLLFGRQIGHDGAAIQSTRHSSPSSDCKKSLRCAACSALLSSVGDGYLFLFRHRNGFFCNVSWKSSVKSF